MVHLVVHTVSTGMYSAMVHLVVHSTGMYSASQSELRDVIHTHIYAYLCSVLVNL